jgi:hypothetical protein
MFAALVTAVVLAAAPQPPPWLTRALWDRESIPQASKVTWTERLPGFETSELEATLDGLVVDRLQLVRVDPKRFRFTVHNEPAQPLTVTEWQRALGAVAVVNGSYYLMDNTPETPLRTFGKRLGPAAYSSRHGAFVADARGAGVVDLAGKRVDDVIAAFPHAMVSYPLLLDESGVVRAQGNPTWLANRTFVGVDSDGKVLLGTTETGFFALRRFGQFLKRSPLRLRIALNLDGGPVACQAVNAGGFTRTLYGQWEANDSSGAVRVFWGYGDEQHWALPVVLAVLPR